MYMYIRLRVAPEETTKVGTQSPPKLSGFEQKRETNPLNRLTRHPVPYTPLALHFSICAAPSQPFSTPRGLEPIDPAITARSTLSIG